MFVFAGLAALSLIQGIIDTMAPSLSGGEPFSLLFDNAVRFGPGFLAVYIYLHNLGLACLVPGFGFIAAWFERHTPNRARIGALLVIAVFASLLTALYYIATRSEMFTVSFALALFVAEATAVLVLAVPAAYELKDFVPTPAYGWALHDPYVRLVPYFIVSATALAALSVIEAAFIIL